MLNLKANSSRAKTKANKKTFARCEAALMLLVLLNQKGFTLPIQTTKIKPHYKKAFQYDAYCPLVKQKGGVPSCHPLHSTPFTEPPFMEPLPFTEPPSQHPSFMAPPCGQTLLKTFPQLHLWVVIRDFYMEFHTFINLKFT